jgi:hypothetical protein
VSGPIKVGDEVVVAVPTPCCGNAENVGRVFVVQAIRRNDPSPCFCCGTLRAGDTLTLGQKEAA